jgi:hypothetical protein
MSNNITIEIFDSSGRLRSVGDLEKEITALDDPTITENFAALKAAIEDLARLDATVEAAKDSIATCIQQIAAGERYLKDNYPPMTQTQAAKAWIASQRA